MESQQLHQNSPNLQNRYHKDRDISFDLEATWSTNY